MGTFTIQPHGRLQEWIADEKGYFHDAGLDYTLNIRDRTLGGGVPVPVVPDQPGAVAIVFLPYSRAMFDKTQAWMHERNLFDVGPEVGVGYDVAVRRASKLR
jgi:hypothetical protein